MPLRQYARLFPIVAMLAVAAISAQADRNSAQGSDVRVARQTDGTFTLIRNGEPYQVKGAGWGSANTSQGDSLALLADSGGNSIRTWGIEQLEQLIDGKPLLDRAHELGITVSAGFWVAHPRHGFDYGEPASLNRQRQRLRDAVLKYKDHPALLTWGLGNEMEHVFKAGEGDNGDVRIWQELDHLAAIIKELDPHHPVMTVIAGAAPTKIRTILEHYPQLDILGVNAYSGGAGVGKSLLESGWNGPYVLTEFGVSGTWEVAATPWGAPIEQDPSTKAGASYTTYMLDQKNNVGRTLGSYVFIWGSKQEATSSWFSMLLPTGEKLPRVDAMAYAWTGDWPENRAPKIRTLTSPVAFKKVDAGVRSYATVDCIDREGDALAFTWEIRAESTDRRVGGDAEAAPPSFSAAIKKGQGTSRVEFETPKRPGGYRVFVTVLDGNGGAVVHNLPFFVEG
ncbi:MAG: glycoside hydrolase family 2 TIM barrel-domain containing protein [Gammaproteobacteria bacterium]